MSTPIRAMALLLAVMVIAASCGSSSNGNDAAPAAVTVPTVTVPTNTVTVPTVTVPTNTVTAADDTDDSVTETDDTDTDDTETDTDDTETDVTVTDTETDVTDTDTDTETDDGAAELDTTDVPATGETPDSADHADEIDAPAADSPATLFVDGALTSEPVIVDCTLENGSETTCYQVEVASLATTVDTSGPYCPATTGDVGGIWVWDGAEPGLYALDGDFWEMMIAQGFDFVDAEGNISITNPGAGPADASATANSCLEAAPDGSFHLRVLLPTAPELLDTPTDLSTVSQIGLALDGVTIFGDAPSVADRGGLPALDACGGHIDPSGYYHWHFGAESIQTNLDQAGVALTCEVEQDADTLIGFSYDGYGIYGPEEDGSTPSDLDECSGHVSNTEEFGTVYHYHLTYESPNLPLCRVGAGAVDKLTSPDSDSAALPDGGGGPPGGGPGNGAPPDGGPPGDGG